METLDLNNVNLYEAYIELSDMNIIEEYDIDIDILNIIEDIIKEI